MINRRTFNSFLLGSLMATPALAYTPPDISLMKKLVERNENGVLSIMRKMHFTQLDTWRIGHPEKSFKEYFESETELYEDDEYLFVYTLVDAGGSLYPFQLPRAQIMLSESVFNFKKTIDQQNSIPYNVKSRYPNPERYTALTPRLIHSLDHLIT